MDRRSTRSDNNVASHLRSADRKGKDNENSSSGLCDSETLARPLNSGATPIDIKTQEKSKPTICGPVRRSPRKTSKEAQQRVIEAARGLSRNRKTAEKRDNVVEISADLPEPTEEKTAKQSSTRRSTRQRGTKDQDHDADKPEKSDIELKESNAPQTGGKGRGRKPTKSSSPKGKKTAKANKKEEQKCDPAKKEKIEEVVTSAPSVIVEYLDSPPREPFHKDHDFEHDTNQEIPKTGSEKIEEHPSKYQNNLFDSISSETKDEESQKEPTPMVKVEPEKERKEEIIKKPENSESDTDESDLDDGEFDDYDDDDSDFDPEEDPHKLYCICNKPHGNRFMICCDKCEEWFHGDCVGITITRGREMDKNDEEWICPRCKGIAPKKVALAIKSQNPNKLIKAQHLVDSKGKLDQEKIKPEKKTEAMSLKPDKSAVTTMRHPVVDSTTKEHTSTLKKEGSEDHDKEKEAKKIVKSETASLHAFDKNPDKYKIAHEKDEPHSSSKTAKDDPPLINKVKKEKKDHKTVRHKSIEEPTDHGPKISSPEVKKDIKHEKVKHKHSVKSTPEIPSLDETFTYEKVKDFKPKRQKSLEDTTEGSADTKKSKEVTKSEAKDHSVPEHEEGEHDEFPKKRKTAEQRFRIPKKVRTTPTPKAFRPVSHVRLCIGEGCQKHALKNAVYCSSKCIVRHTELCLAILEEEKQRKFGTLSPESVKTTSDASKVPASSDSAAADALHSHKLNSNDRIAVVEKSSGKLMAGVMAPTKEKLVPWLEEHPTYEVLTTGKTNSMQKKEKKDQDDIVRNNVKRSLKDTLLARCRELDLTVDSDEMMKLSQVIEEEMYGYFGDTGQKYKTKYRSLIFNLKDHKNRILYKRVVMGDISPEKLVRMSPEQLASSELAKWREREAKHNLEMIKKREEEEAYMLKHAVKKTHKGEIEINEDSNLAETLEVKAESTEDKAHTPTSEGASLLEDTTEQHTTHLFDLNCKICTGKLTPPGEQHTVTSGHIPSSIPEEVSEASVPSPTEDDRKQRSPGLMEFHDALTSVASLNKDPPVWKGFIMMQNVAKFVTRAYRVSGSCDNLLQVLPDTIHVCGRIPHEEVWDYLYQLKSSTNKVIDVLRFEMASADEKAGYVALYSYFYTRKRIGVVGNCYSGVKDMYLVPLASHDPVPPELKPFDGPGLPTPRPHMLLGVIIKLRQSKRSKSHVDKHDAKKRRKSSLSTPPDSPNEQTDNIVYGNVQRKKSSSSKSSVSSESSNTPTPDLGSPSGSSVAVTSPVSMATVVKPSVATSDPQSEVIITPVSPPSTLSRAASVSLPSILTKMIAPIASTAPTYNVGEHDSKPVENMQIETSQDLRTVSSPHPIASVVPPLPLTSLMPSCSVANTTDVSVPLVISATRVVSVAQTLLGSSPSNSSSARPIPSASIALKMDTTTETDIDNVAKPGVTTSSADDEPYDPEDDFVIDLIEDIPLPTPKDKVKLPLPLDMPKKPEERPLPALPPLPLPGLQSSNSALKVDIPPFHPAVLPHPQRPNFPRARYGMEVGESGHRYPDSNFLVRHQIHHTSVQRLPPPQKTNELQQNFPPSHQIILPGLANRDNQHNYRPSSPPVATTYEHWPKDSTHEPPHSHASQPPNLNFGHPSIEQPVGSEPHIVPISPVAVSPPEVKPWNLNSTLYSQVTSVSPPQPTDQVPEENIGISREVHAFLRETRRTQEGSEQENRDRFPSRPAHGPEERYEAMDRSHIDSSIRERHPTDQHYRGQQPHRWQEEESRRVMTNQGPGSEISDCEFIPEHHRQEQSQNQYPSQGHSPRHPGATHFHHSSQPHPPQPHTQQYPPRPTYPPEEFPPRSSIPPHHPAHDESYDKHWQRNVRRPSFGKETSKGSCDMEIEEGHGVMYPVHTADPERDGQSNTQRPFLTQSEFADHIKAEISYQDHGRRPLQHDDERHPRSVKGDERQPPPEHRRRSLDRPPFTDGNQEPPHGYMPPHVRHQDQPGTRQHHPDHFQKPMAFERKTGDINEGRRLEHEHHGLYIENREQVTREQTHTALQRMPRHRDQEQEHGPHDYPPIRPLAPPTDGRRNEFAHQRVDENHEGYRATDSVRDGPPPDHNRFHQQRRGFGRARGRGYDHSHERGHGRGQFYPNERGHGRSRGRGQFQSGEESEWRERNTSLQEQSWREHPFSNQDVGPDRQNESKSDREQDENFGVDNRYSNHLGNAPWRNRRSSEPGRFHRGRPGRGAWQ